MTTQTCKGYIIAELNDRKLIKFDQSKALHGIIIATIL